MYTVHVKDNSTRQRQTQQGNTIILQKMALDVEGDWPLVFEMRVDEPLRPGTYTWVPTFRTDRWGGIELNPFENQFIPSGK